MYILYNNRSIKASFDVEKKDKKKRPLQAFIQFLQVKLIATYFRRIHL